MSSGQRLGAAERVRNGGIGVTVVSSANYAELVGLGCRSLSIGAGVVVLGECVGGVRPLFD